MNEPGFIPVGCFWGPQMTPLFGSGFLVWKMTETNHFSADLQSFVFLKDFHHPFSKFGEGFLESR